MTTDREILKKLFKIAKNQQKILNKLAAGSAGIQRYIEVQTYAWLANQIGQGQISNVEAGSSKVVNVEVTEEPTGKLDAVVTFRPPEAWGPHTIENLKNKVENRSYTQMQGDLGGAPEYERYMYQMLAKQKGLQPSQIRLRVFVVEPTFSETKQTQPNKPPVGQPEEGLKPNIPGKQMEKIRLR